MDAIFESIGAFGLYQRLMLVLVGSISALAAMNIYCTVFMLAEPVLECSIVALNETTSSSSDEAKVCQIWSNYTKTRGENSSYACKFDTTYYTSTIITDWDLTCDRKYLASLTQTFFMIGTISGMASGVLSDRYGRKFSTLLFITLLSISLVGTQLLLLIDGSLLYKYTVFSVSQFLCGIISNCLYCTAYVLLLEMTTDNYHTIVSNLNLYFFVLGELIVLASYYITRSWYMLAWIISIYSVVFVILTFLTISESPRWLTAQKRYEDACVVLNKIAKVNGVKKVFNNDSLESLNEINNHKPQQQHDPLSSTTTLSSKITTKRIFSSIFCPNENFMNIYLLIYIWIAISLLYFGVSMGITSIDFSDPYLIFLISSIVEIIGLSMCYLNDKLGRKKALFAYLITASITCSVVAILPQQPHDTIGVTWKFILRMSLALVGKCMVSAAFNTCYMFTVELYDTNVRNTVILFLTCIGGIGSLISPQINLLRSVVWQPLPYIIYSASSFLACFALLLLPETHHHHK